MKTTIMASAALLTVAIAVGLTKNDRVEMVIPAKEVQEITCEEVLKDHNMAEGPEVMHFDMEAVPEGLIYLSTVEEEAEAEESTNKWYSDDFYYLNDCIKEYADLYASFDYHGTQIDGLAVMAQANCESAYMCDPNKTLTALYPSRFVDITSPSDIEELDITKVWGSSKSLNGTYAEMPYWGYNAGPYYAWSSGDGRCEQGPLQQRVTPTSLEALDGATSEYDKLVSSGTLYTAANTLYGYEATRLCTGTDGLDWTLGYDTYGDRWSIKDNCIIWKADKQDILDDLWDTYYSTCGYTPSTEEVLAVLSYAHWIPEIIKGNGTNAQVQYYGFAYQGAWFDLCHQLSSDAALAVIKDYVKRDIDENRSLYYDSYYSKEEATQLFNIALSAGSTTNVYDSEPWQIFNELSNKGLIDSSTVLTYPAYGYQHAMKYAIQYLYAYEMLNTLLIEQY